MDGFDVSGVVGESTVARFVSACALGLRWHDVTAWPRRLFDLRGKCPRVFGRHGAMPRYQYAPKVARLVPKALNNISVWLDVTCLA